MSKQKGLVPQDYQAQVQRLKAENKPLYIYINGIKTLAMYTKQGWKPYVEVAERLRILHEKICNKEIESFEMAESGPYEVGEDLIYWRVKIIINGLSFIGNVQVHYKGIDPTSADGKDCFANAETSALGRALGAAGLGTVDGLASADEMQSTGFESEAPPNVVGSNKYIANTTSPLTENAKLLLAELQERATKLYGAGKWETVKRRAGILEDGQVIPDERLSRIAVNVIDAKLTEREKFVEANVQSGK